MEIERKWIANENSIRHLLDIETGVRIEQHYINGSTDEWVIRARCYGEKFFLTLKSKGLLSRHELEYEITEEQYLETIKHSVKSIKKIRYSILSFLGEDLVYEIDVYDFYNFITCEVEFKTEKEANEFVPPDWCMIEVTEDPTYQNVNLARP